MILGNEIMHIIPSLAYSWFWDPIINIIVINNKYLEQVSNLSTGTYLGWDISHENEKHLLIHKKSTKFTQVSGLLNNALEPYLVHKCS